MGNVFLTRSIMKHLRVANLFLPDFRGKLQFIAEKYGLLAFNLLLRALRFRPNIAIFYTVDYVFLLNSLRSMKVKIIYDCVDETSAFSDRSEAGSTILKAEENLVRKSSLTIASAKVLYEKIVKIKSNCIYIPNASDFGHFNKAAQTMKKPKEIETLKHPVIGFIGAIFDWIDTDLLCKMAQAHPEYSILLVGPVNSGLDELKKHPNIVMVGAKNYQLLPKYLASMDVCLIPFKINKLTRASNPIKMYEYLAAGKPVVSTALPEICNNASEVVYIGKDREDFIKKVERVVNETEDKAMISRRIDYARDNSWEKRVKTIEALLRNI